jgi:hypothetical protein
VHAHLLLVGAARLAVGTDQGRVVDGRRRARQRVVGVAVAVGLEALVRERALLDDHELRLADPAEVPVEAVVLDLRHQDVLEVDRAAEDLDAVVGAEVALDVVDDRRRTAGADRERVELVVGRQLEAGTRRAGSYLRVVAAAPYWVPVVPLEALICEVPLVMLIARVSAPNRPVAGQARPRAAAGL